MSHEKIAAAAGMSKDSVSNAAQRAVQEGARWPLPADMDDSRSRTVTLLDVREAMELWRTRARDALIASETRKQRKQSSHEK